MYGAADPLFENRANEDYSIRSGSPVIDAAPYFDFFDGLFFDDLDLVGNPRYRDDPETPDTGALGPFGLPVPDFGPIEFQPVCPGDANGDRHVNITDLNLVLGNFGQSASPGIPGDLNQNGVVNITDVNLVLGNFGHFCL